MEKRNKIKTGVLLVDIRLYEYQLSTWCLHGMQRNVVRNLAKSYILKSVKTESKFQEVVTPELRI